MCMKTAASLTGSTTAWTPLCRTARKFAGGWPKYCANGALAEDGEWLTLTGRDGARYHCIERFVWREHGLDQVLDFCKRASGFFL